MAKKIKPANQKKWVSPVDSGLVNFLDYYKDEKIEEARTYFLKCYDESKTWRAPYRANWLEYYQLYRGYSSYYESKPMHESAYFIMKIFEFIEIIKPRIMEALYGFPPMWIGLPASEKMKKATQIVEMLLDTRVRQMGLFYQHLQTFTDMLVYGTAFQKMGYEVRSDYEGPWWWAKDLFDMFPDPLNTEINDMRYLIDRGVNHIEYFKEMERYGVFENVDKIERGAGEKTFSGLDRLRTIGLSSQNATVRTEDHHELLECWGRWHDEDSDEYFDVVFDIVDRKHVVRFEECPYYFQEGKEGWFYAQKPYIAYRDVPVPHEFYGIGEAEIMRYLNLELNDFRNMRADAAHYSISPVYQVIKAGIEGQDLDNITFAPGAMIPMNFIGTDPIKPVPRDMSWFAAYREGDAIESDLRNVTGIQLPLAGSEGNIRKTATEVVSYINESLSRIKLKIQIIDHCSLSVQGRMTYMLDKQFTDTEVLAKIFDVQGVKAYAKITPNQIKWEGDMQLQPLSRYGMRQIEVQRLMEFLKVAVTVPEAEKRIRFDILIQEIADSLEIRNKDLVVSNEEAEAAAKKQREEEAAAAAAAQPQPGGLSLVPGTGGAMLPPEMAGMAPTLPAAGGGESEAVLSEILSQAAMNAPMLPPV